MRCHEWLAKFDKRSASTRTYLSLGVWVYHQDQTPLHCAASKGHANVCALLLDRGASLEALDDDVFYFGLLL